jgi:branched-chain amino acid transport system permease protein
LMGSFIVLVVIFAPRGLLGLVEKFTSKKTTALPDSGEVKP